MDTSSAFLQLGLLFAVAGSQAGGPSIDSGCVIHGIVVDARTGNPIEGALVSPVVFTPPLFTPDRDRAVKTDAKGSFTIKGVDYDLGINVWHRDYLEFNRNGFTKVGKKTGEHSYEARIALKTGETLFGVVKDAAGNPLAGVEVSDGAGKRVQTGTDGSFVLRSPSKWSGEATHHVSFEKEDYLDEQLRPRSAAPAGFSIVLRLQPLLRGRVVGPEGLAVSAYEIWAGAGVEPGRWKCSSQRVSDADGRFFLRVRTDRDYEKEGKVWVGLRAPGFAVWETTIDTWQGTQSVTAHLKPGVSVRGSIDEPENHAGEMFAKLLPVRIHQERFTSETSQRQELGRSATTIGASGAFHIDHVSPGQYLLAIAGRNVSPIGTAITVSDSDLDVGSFSPRGRGSITGVAYQPQNHEVWALADGSISFQDTSGNSNDNAFDHLRPISFKTDEQGRFRVDGVPAGMVWVSFPYPFSADVIGAYSRQANVLEGKTTEVRLFDTTGDWELVFKFVIGDGSAAQFASGTGMGAARKVGNVTTRPPMFRIELEPKQDVPASFGASDWQELDDAKQIVLRDVQPGSYRFAVGDWLMSRGFRGVLYEGSVDVDPQGASAVTIPLGAGSITGAVRWSKEIRYMVHVVAVGKRTGTVRHARCDSLGNFCVRYLPEDAYTLFAHDYDAGWCQLPDVSVKNNITDIGTHQLLPGATITGTLPTHLGTVRAVRIVATDPHGIPIESPNHDEPIGRTFTISGLWPGEWTVTLKKGEAAIGKHVVALHRTETVTCHLLDE